MQISSEMLEIGFCRKGLLKIYTRPQGSLIKGRESSSEKGQKRINREKIGLSIYLSFSCNF